MLNFLSINFGAVSKCGGRSWNQEERSVGSEDKHQNSSGERPHWTNGNVTEDGIAKDLEWMKRSGIGGLPLSHSSR
jgi:hypothetical protein